MGNDERVSADTALRIGLVSEVVSRDQLWARAHAIAATIAAKPPSATQGTVKAIWESLDKPYRAALEQNLIYTRLGNPIGTAELARTGRAGEVRATDPVMTDHPLRQRIAAVLDLAPDASAIEYDGQWFTYGQVGALARRIASLVDGRGQVGMLLRNRPAHVAAFLGVLLAGGTVVVINPSRGDERTKADIAALELPVIIGERRRSGEAGRAGAPDRR